MLLPALNAAKTRAQDTLCKNNLKQIQLALVSYLNDNKEWYYHYTGTISAFPQYSLVARLSGYLGGSQFDDIMNNTSLQDDKLMPKVFICPLLSRRAGYENAILPGYSFAHTSTRLGVIKSVPSYGVYSDNLGKKDKLVLVSDAYADPASYKITELAGDDSVKGTIDMRHRKCANILTADLQMHSLTLKDRILNAPIGQFPYLVLSGGEYRFISKYYVNNTLF